jgi:hypothetical protein
MSKRHRVTSPSLAVVPAVLLSLVACGGAAPAPANPATAAVAGCSEAAIDDMNDGDVKVLPNKGRNGYWYNYADPSSKVGPTPFVMAKSGADGSKGAAEMTGKIGTDKTIYAGFGTNFLEPKKPYDASSYKGITFKAKIGKGAAKVRLQVADANTDPIGDVCKNCYNHFGQDLTLTTEWKKYVVTWKDLTQEAGWGDAKPAIDPAKLNAVQWQVKEAGADFDVWIDNLEFTCQ